LNITKRILLARNLDETIGPYTLNVMISRREPVRRRRAALSRPRVHARGEARLDAMLDLTEEATRAAPIEAVLSSMCERIARMLAVDVCSIYLREPLRDDRRGGDLVLRATFGYPETAVGAVRMRVGEGLTGFAVECLRPVSVARAAVDARNKAFPGLDEERFPSLCAVPLVDGGRAVGALVIQRRQPRKFGSREMVLAAAVTAPVLFALERARSFAEQKLAPRDLAARPHDVTLRGLGVSPSCALGNVLVRRTHAHRAAPYNEPAYRDAAEERARLGKALADAAEEVAALEAWAMTHAPIDRGTMLGLLSPSRYVLDDARMRGRMLKHVEAGASAEEAVERVMREYTRLLATSPISHGDGDPLLAQRALEVEALCQRVMARLADEPRALPPGAVLCASRLTVCDALELAAAHGVAVALSSKSAESPGVAVAVALGLPVVVGVSELFRWVADGDRALVSGEDGTLTVNPSSVDIAQHRRR
jgi:phosphotransferase system enzyme I (PtsP)